MHDFFKQVTWSVLGMAVFIGIMALSIRYGDLITPRGAHQIVSVLICMTIVAVLRVAILRVLSGDPPAVISEKTVVTVWQTALVIAVFTAIFIRWSSPSQCGEQCGYEVFVIPMTFLSVAIVFFATELKWKLSS